MSVQTEPVSLVELWAEDHARLRLEIARLKVLIKAAEGSADTDGASECPWCRSVRSQCRHEADCPAFTPTGEVR